MDFSDIDLMEADDAVGCLTESELTMLDIETARGNFGLINEPAALVQSFAKRSGKSVAEVEKLWDEVKAAAKKKFKEDSPRFYQYITGTLKKVLKLD